MNAPRPSTADLLGHGMGIRLYGPTWFTPLPGSFELETDGNAVVLATWPNGVDGDVENLFLVPDTGAGSVDLPFRHERRGSVTLGLSHNAPDAERFGEYLDVPEVPTWLVRYRGLEFTMPDALCRLEAERLEITQQGLATDEFVSFGGPHLPGLGMTFDELVASHRDAGHRVADTGVLETGGGTSEFLEARYEHDGQQWRQFVHLCHLGAEDVTAFVRGQSLDMRDDDPIRDICLDVVGALRVEEGLAEATREVVARAGGGRREG